MGLLRRLCALPCCLLLVAALGLMFTACGRGNRAAQVAFPTPVTVAPTLTPTATVGPSLPAPALGGSLSPSVSPSADAWASLRARPLRLPSLAPGSTCPIATTPTDGPFYPAGVGGGVLTWSQERNEGGWRHFKTLWVAGREARGPVLIRGHQLDGPNELRFWRNGRPEGTELGFPTVVGKFPSATSVRAPGCYGFQVDGPDFSEVIIFDVRP